MRKATKLWLIAATFFVILGAAMFAAIMTKNHWDFMQLNTTEFKTNTHLISESFNNINIESSTANIIFVPSKDSTCQVVCIESANERHLVNVENQTLSISVTNEKKWYDYVGIINTSPQLTIYLPETQYNQLSIVENTGDIKIPKDFYFESMNITTSTGDIDNKASAAKDIKLTVSSGDIIIDSISANTMNFSVSTGEIIGDSLTCEENLTITVGSGFTTLTNVTCDSLTTTGNTGNLSLKNVIAADKISIERSTGDVNFDKSDATELFIQTDTGHVKGSLLTDKIFSIDTSTGDIDVPKSLSGGACEVKTSTGDVKITID